MYKRVYCNAAKKIAAALLCLAMITVINFLLPRLMPGDPVLMLTGMDEAAVSSTQYQVYRDELGLDKPLILQFADYLGGLLRGDLGYSWHLNAKVGSVIASRIPATLQIALPALLLSSLVAVLLGCLCGSGAGGAADRAVSSSMILLDAVPGFLLSMTVVYFFGLRLGWLPLGGLGSAVALTGATALWDRLTHLLLPVLVVTLSSLPAKYMLVRSAAAAEMNRPYPMYAAARGLSDTRIRYLHIFPNACRPFVAMLGVNAGFILSGSMVVETVFSIKGMGGLLHQAIMTRDLPVMQGCLFVTALAVIVATIVSDAVLLFISPKARCGVYEK